MATLFALLFLIALIGTIVFLINPSLTQFKSKPALSRGKILLYGLALNFVFLALVGVFAPEVDNTDGQAAAPATQNAAPPEVAKKEVQPAKVEASLGMTPEQFRQAFNKQLKTLKIDTIRPLAEFDIEKGETQDIFQVMFSTDVGMTGIVNKEGFLRELVFIVGGTDNTENATLDMIILTGISSQIFTPQTNISPDILDLMTQALKDLDVADNMHKKTIGHIEYFATANRVTGLWVGISPAGE